MAKCANLGCNDQIDILGVCKDHLCTIPNPNNTCLGPLCDRKVIAHNLCTTHYKQRSRGNILRPLRIRANAQDRFWRYVNKETEFDCWEWTQSLDKSGYGQFLVEANRRVLTHRYAYELVYNIKLLKAQSLDHLCRNRKCCNPDHLEIVSMRENTKRMLSYKVLANEIKRLRSLLIKSGIEPGFDVLNKEENYTKEA